MLNVLGTLFFGSFSLRLAIPLLLLGDTRSQYLRIAYNRESAVFRSVWINFVWTNALMGKSYGRLLVPTVRCTFSSND